MKIKPLTLLNAVLTVCLLATLFFTSGTLTGRSGYDPWYDVDDDGDIDMKDIGTLCLLYGAEGDPTKNVTVTNFPDELNVHMVHHTLNVTLAKNRYIERGTWDFYKLNVSKYVQVSLGMDVVEDFPSGAEFYVYWIIGGVCASVKFYDNVHGSRLDTLVVQGEAIEIRVQVDPDYSAPYQTYSLGLYATD